MSFQTKKIFYINTNMRESGTHSNFSYKIDLKDHDVDSVSVLQANIPKSYYMVQANKNTFTLTEGVTSYTITIPPGNYTRSNFRTTVQNLMNGNGSVFTYTVEIPLKTTADTGKYYYVVSANDSQPSFTFASDNNVYELMGFTPGTHTFVGDTLDSENVIKLHREDTIYIHSDIAGGSTNTMLQEVYADGSDFDHIVFINRNPEMYSKSINSSHDGVYRFFITNEDGEILDLNGLNWTMTLVAYKKNDIHVLMSHLFNVLKSRI